MPDSVRLRLTLWYSGVLALVLVLFSFGVYALMKGSLFSRVDTTLRIGIEGISRRFLHEKEEGEDDESSAISTLKRTYLPYAVAFYNARGMLLAEQPVGGTVHSPPPDSAMLAGEDMRIFTLPKAQTGTEGGLRVAVFRLGGPSVKSPCFAVISEPLTDVSNALEMLRGILFVVVPAALALAGLGGWFLARKTLAPVVAMSESARRIGATNLDERLPVANPRDELGRLAGTFNELLGRLHQAFAQQRQFMADASHELRTPLSVIRAASEVTLERPHRAEGEYREAHSIVNEQALRLARIVEDMFTLARADAGQRVLEPSDFYLDELVAETARAAGFLAARKQVTVESEVAPEAFFHGDEDLLRRMLLDLLDNAIKYTLPGGHVRVVLEQKDACYAVTVADTGIGIPVPSQPHIFRRFYRVDKARSRADSANGGGAGLGLSIARWIAEAHGGSLRLERSDRSGSIFVATLPAPAAGSSDSGFPVNSRQTPELVPVLLKDVPRALRRGDVDPASVS